MMSKTESKSFYSESTSETGSKIPSFHWRNLFFVFMFLHVNALLSTVFAYQISGSKSPKCDWRKIIEWSCYCCVNFFLDALSWQPLLNPVSYRLQSSHTSTHTMGFLTHESKARIIRLRARGEGVTEIVRILAEDDVKISRWGLIKFLKRYDERQSLENAPKTGRPVEGVSIELMNFIDAEMERNDEMTSPELTRRVNQRFEKLFSQDKVKRLRRKLGWVCTTTKYCQLIREPNRIKRLEFAEKCLQDAEQFNDVIFTDECSVLLENHTKISFHREWEQPKLKGRPKHPIKVHVWAGISKKGPTKLLIFEGVMEASFFVTEILTNGLLPFIRETFPDGHRFQQDNDPKHTSRVARSFLEDNNINWWKTPAESPDLNPIELMWHELKHYLRSIIKPITKEDLVGGISRFWDEKVDAAKCSKYIGHLQTVIPIVVARQGKASGH